jgi:hypothetical protein
MYKKITVIADEKFDNWVHLMISQKGSFYDLMIHIFEDYTDSFYSCYVEALKVVKFYLIKKFVHIN